MTVALPRPAVLARDLRPSLARLARGATHVLLAIVFLLLPFEGLLVLIRTRDHLWTDLELLILATIGAWVATLLLEGRRPRVPRSVVIGVTALAVIWLASSLGAGPWSHAAFVTTGRAALSWGVLLLTVDLVRRPVDVTRLVAVLLTSTTMAALIGFVTLARGSTDGLPGPVRLYTVAGVPRLTGTFDYPTIAATVWATTLVLALPIVADGRRLVRLVVWVALAVVGAALLLTLSRGALLGLGTGLAVLLVLAGLARSRALLKVTAVGTVAMVAGATAVVLLGPLPVGRVLMEGDRDLYAARYVVAGRIALTPGEVRRVPVTVTNTGSASWNAGGPDAVTLVQRWRMPGAQGYVLRTDARSSLPVRVDPGRTITLAATVRAPAVTGDMRIAWDLEQARMGGFSERAVPVAVSDLAVTPDARPDVSDTVPAPTQQLYPDLLLEPTRGELWSAAVAITAERPLLGSGPGTFRRIYGAYLGRTRWDSQIHSNDLYLEVAATTGLVGLVAFLAVLGLVLLPQVRHVPRPRDARRATVVAALVAATAVALGHGLVDVFLAFVPTAVLFWGLLGMGLGLTLADPRQRADVAA